MMEIEHSVGPGAITEFDRMFEIGCKAIAHALAGCVGRLGRREKSRAAALSPKAELDRLLEQIAEVLLRLLAQPQPRRAALGPGNGQRRIPLAAI